MNTLIIYIEPRIRQISLKGVNDLLLEIISKGGRRFILYLKKKCFEKWLNTFIPEKAQRINIKDIINENLYPIIHSSHSILIDSLYKSNKEKKEKFDENDMQDQQFANSLKDVNANTNLLGTLLQYFISE